MEYEIVANDGGVAGNNYSIGYINGEPAQWFGNDAPDIEADDTTVYPEYLWDQCTFRGPYGEIYRINDDGEWYESCD